MTIADRIRSFREQKRMSLGELSNRSGVSKGYLSALEREIADNPSVEALTKIARALEVQLSDLIEETPDPSAPSPRGLPPGLAAFLEERREKGEPLTRSDLEMLMTIRYRGRRPTSAEDYAYLYETIRRIVE